MVTADANAAGDASVTERRYASVRQKDGLQKPYCAKGEGSQEVFARTNQEMSRRNWKASLRVARIGEA